MPSVGTWIPHNSVSPVARPVYFNVKCIPMSQHISLVEDSNVTAIPVRFFEAGVSAGFPSPAADYMQEEIDLNAYLKPRPAATFLIRVTGDSMIEAFIPDGALLVI